MPETEYEYITKDWLQSELRSDAKDLIILDCRSSNEYTECHIRSAVNFSIPSIMLRRLAAGKLDLLSTIKSRDLKDRIQNAYKISLFVLYNDNNFMQTAQFENVMSVSGSGIGGIIGGGHDCGVGGGEGGGGGGVNDSGGGGDGGVGGDICGSTGNQAFINCIGNTNSSGTGCSSTLIGGTISGGLGGLGGNVSGGGGGGGSVGIGSGGFYLNDSNCYNSITNENGCNDSMINVLHRRLKQDGCRVVCLQDGFTSFRDAFPEWCEDDNNQNQEMESSRGTQADQLMGLRSLRISTPHSDSACSSSAESSDCESTIHHNFNDAPVEIIPGLFLGNASHSGDSGALQKYNIKYVLNVTPDLPNVFEATGGIQYLQIPITDHYSQDLAMHFPAAIQFIEKARCKDSAVLVHCLAGVSRSVTVTLAYLMHTRDLCLNDAFTLVRDRKPDVSPNFHFMEQLHSFEKKLRLSPHNLTSADAITNCDRYPRNTNKFTCNCVEADCKCLMEADFLANVKATGVSPDSGIEFDRWTPSDASLK